MKITAIIQARTNSSRFPNKILMEINGKTMLQLVLERVRKARLIDSIIIATTDKMSDDRVAKVAKRFDVSVFRGSEHDVLRRYYEASKRYGSDLIVRITADCPLISPNVIDKTIQRYLSTNADYVLALAREDELRSYPRGTNVEVFSQETITEVHKLATNPQHREHVTTYLEEHPKTYKIAYVEAEEKLRRPQYRLTVDTSEDWDLINAIYKAFPSNTFISLYQAISFLDQHPEYLRLNINVKQKIDSSFCQQKTSAVILFRVNASSQLGIIHLVRCLALAHELRKKGYSSYFMCNNDTLCKKIIDPLFPVEYLSNTGSKSVWLNHLGRRMAKIMPLATVMDLKYNLNHDEYLIMRFYSGYLVDINDESVSDTYSDIVFKGDIDSANVEKKNSVHYYMHSKYRMPSKGMRFIDGNGPKCISDVLNTHFERTKGKKMLVVGASSEQTSLIRAAKSLGCTVIVVDRDVEAPGFSISDHGYPVDTKNLNAIRYIAEKHNIDGIITSTTTGMENTSIIAAEIWNNKSLMEISRIMKDKALIKGLFMENSIPTPDFRIIKSPEEILAAVEDLGLPMILKPCDGAGSAGVFKIDTTANLSVFFDAAMKQTAYKYLLLEKFLRGPELGCEVFIYNSAIKSLVLTNKICTRPPHSIVMGHCVPARISSNTKAEILAVLVRIINAIGIKDGPVNFDIILSDSGPVIIDIGWRLGGNSLPLLGFLTTGVNTYKEAIRLALGDPPDLLHRGSWASAIYYLNNTPGIITDISGEDEVQAIQGLVKFEICAKVGDKVSPITHYSDRIGSFVVNAMDSETCDKISSKVKKSLRIKTRKVSV